MGRDSLIAELDNLIKNIKPSVILGDDDSIYLSDYQEGFRDALRMIKQMMEKQ